MRVPALVAGGDFTVGIEDELMLVDDRRRAARRAGRPAGARAAVPPGRAGTGRGRGLRRPGRGRPPRCAGAARRSSTGLTGLRSSLMSGGARILSAGVHPTAAFGGAVTLVVAALRPHRRRVRWAAAHAHRGLPGARRDARRGRVDAGLPRAAAPNAAAACAVGRLALLARPRLRPRLGALGDHPVLPAARRTAAAAHLGRLRHAHGGAARRGRGAGPHLHLVGPATPTAASGPWRCG